MFLVTKHYKLRSLHSSSDYLDKEVGVRYFTNHLWKKNLAFFTDVLGRNVFQRVLFKTGLIKGKNTFAIC